MFATNAELAIFRENSVVLEYIYVTSNNNHFEPLPLILKITNNKYYP